MCFVSNCYKTDNNKKIICSKINVVSFDTIKLNAEMRINFLLID